MHVPAGAVEAFELAIEPDASSAIYWWAAAAMVPGASVHVPIPRESVQPDLGAVDLLEAMGAHVARTSWATHAIAASESIVAAADKAGAAADGRGAGGGVGARGGVATGGGSCAGGAGGVRPGTDGGRSPSSSSASKALESASALPVVTQT